MKLGITCGLVIYDEIDLVQDLIQKMKFELKDYNVDWIFVLNHEQKEIRKWINHWLIENLTDSKLIFENPLNNLGFARNLIVTHSKNELIYLIDPDIELQKNCITQLIEFASHRINAEDDQMTAGYGGTVIHKSENYFINQTYELMAKISVLLPFSFQIQNHKKISKVDHLPSCHLLLKKSKSLMIGNFSHVQSRCGEDIDFTHRAHNLGYHFIFLPTAGVIHWQNMSLSKWLFKIYNFGRAQVRVFTKNYKKGIRLYRILPLIILILTLVFSLKIPYIFGAALSLILMSSLFFKSIFGFILVFLCYSFGEAIEIFLQIFVLEDEVKLQELKVNLTFESFESKIKSHSD